MTDAVAYQVSLLNLSLLKAVRKFCVDGELLLIMRQIGTMSAWQKRRTAPPVDMLFEVPIA